MRSRYGRFSFLGAMVVAALLLLCAGVAPIQAAPGDLVKSIPLSVAGYGVSVAVDCDGVLYYTVLFTDFTGDGLLHKMDKDGNDLGSVAIKDVLAPAGPSLLMDEMSYDQLTNVLWGAEHNTNPIRVWRIDRLTGLATKAFDSVTASIGTFRDGIAVDLSDLTLWLKGDVATDVDHYSFAGVLLNTITPKDAAGSPLGSLSGVQVGVGDLLYLGRNGFGQIVQVKKSDGSFISSFASPGGRDEGLECDPKNFPGKTVIWSRDFFTPGRVDAIEVEGSTCNCGGAVPANQSTWGSIKSRYR